MKRGFGERPGGETSSAGWRHAMNGGIAHPRNLAETRCPLKAEHCHSLLVEKPRSCRRDDRAVWMCSLPTVDWLSGVCGRE